jgi:hypothetical protein
MGTAAFADQSLSAQPMEGLFGDGTCHPDTDPARWLDVGSRGHLGYRQSTRCSGDNWDARLVAAGRLLPDFVLNEAVAHALTELARAAHGVDDPEELVEWIDLLPRNALQLVDVTPWVYRSWHAQRRQASSLSNTVSDATGQAWGSRTGHFRRRVAVA